MKGERKLHFRTAGTRRQAGRRSHPHRAEAGTPSAWHPTLCSPAGSSARVRWREEKPSTPAPAQGSSSIERRNRLATPESATATWETLGALPLSKAPGDAAAAGAGVAAEGSGAVLRPCPRESAAPRGGRHCTGAPCSPAAAAPRSSREACGSRGARRNLDPTRRRPWL